MAVATLKANRDMSKALARAQAHAAEHERQRLADEQRREEMRRVSRGIRDTIETALDHGAKADDIERVDNGPVRILTRDGLLWLIAKGRLSAAQRFAAERYRGDYTIVHASRIKSCVDPTPGGGSGEAVAETVDARQRLARAREVGLNRDPHLIWTVDQVAGEGHTLRDLAGGNDYQARALEVEFGIACRLLARHYGLST